MSKQDQKQKLDDIHQAIDGDYYDESIATNPVKRIFHQMRFKNVGDMIRGAEGDLLDIGCAGGTFTNELSKHCDCNITGLDVSPQAIEYARDNYPHINFEVHDAANPTFPYEDNSFDYITILETLEHVLNPVEVLQEMRRLVKPGGEVIVLVPYEDWLFNIGWSIWTRLPGKMGGGVWDESHVQRFDERKLRHLMEFIGYEILDEKRYNLGLLLGIKATPKEPNVNY